MNTQSVALSVHLLGSTITGIASVPNGVRLSDLLNDRTKKRSSFLTLTNATIKLIDGTRESSKTVHINKQSIQMVTTLESDSKGIGANVNPKQYPFIEKRPVLATVRLPDYELTGYLYCVGTKEATDIFTEEQSFMPITDTMIYDVNSDIRWRTDFASINKKHVSCLKENGLHS